MLVAASFAGRALFARRGGRSGFWSRCRQVAGGAIESANAVAVVYGEGEGAELLRVLRPAVAHRVEVTVQPLPRIPQIGLVFGARRQSLSTIGIGTIHHQCCHSHVRAGFSSGG